MEGERQTHVVPYLEMLERLIQAVKTLYKREEWSEIVKHGKRNGQRFGKLTVTFPRESNHTIIPRLT